MMSMKIRVVWGFRLGRRLENGKGSRGEEMGKGVVD
jgi:hypothetical protein